jgi:CRP/FNR family transcriptional regulator, cyclic AMP receptor protein
VVIKRVKKNKVILYEENTNDFMYIILDGETRVVQTTENGKKIFLAIHRAGDFFGELSLIDGKTAPADVIATKDSVIAIISKEDFFSLVYSQPKVVDNLLGILCYQIRDQLKKIQLLNFKNAAQRIKMLLLMLADVHGEKIEGGTVLRLKLSHQNIADMTGLTRETVTRILDRWQKGGEIKKLKNKSILLCPEFDSISF